MDNWWIVVICIAAAVVLHIFVQIKRSSALAVVTVLLHMGGIVMLLLLEAALRQLFVFMAASLAANLICRQIALRRLRKSKNALETVQENAATPDGKSEKSADTCGGEDKP